MNESPLTTEALRAHLSTLAARTRWALYANAVVPPLLTLAYVFVLARVGAEDAEAVQNANKIDVALMLANLGLIGLGGITFLAWLAAAYRVGISLTGSVALRRHKATGLAASFLVPIVNLVRPYHAVKALHDVLDPNDVPLLPPRPVPRTGEHTEGYRTPAIDEDAIRARFRPLPKRAPVGLWWGLWIARVGTYLAGRGAPDSWVPQIVGLLVDAAAAITCAVMVARITERIVEYAVRKDLVAADAERDTPPAPAG